MSAASPRTRGGGASDITAQAMTTSARDTPRPADEQAPDSTVAGVESRRSFALSLLPGWSRARPEEGPKEFPTVFADEMKVIAERREARGLDAGSLRDAPHPSADLGLIGLSLSGGGIRSSSFSLGVLQALERANLLRHFDYLSTVSGGGFIGSAVTSAGGQPLARSRGTDTPLVTHLRNRSSYLNPGGLLNGARLPALILRGLSLNVLALVPLLLLAAVLTELCYVVGYNHPSWLLNDDYDPLAGLLLVVPFLVLLTAYPLVPLCEQRFKGLRNRYEALFAGAFVLAGVGVVAHFALRFVVYAIENGEVAERYMALFFKDWLLLSILLPVGCVLLRSRSSWLARSLRGLALLTAGAVVPAGLFAAYIFLCIQIIPNPTLQGDVDAHLTNLVELDQRAAEEADGGSCADSSPPPMAESMAEPMTGSLIGSSAAASTGATALSQDIAVWLERHKLKLDGGDVRCKQGACKALAGGSAAAVIEACTAPLRTCETQEECDSCKAGGCCWTFTDANTGDCVQLTLWRNKRTDEIRVALYEIPLWSSLSPVQLARYMAHADTDRVISWSLGLGLLLVFGFYGLSNANELSLHGFYRDCLQRTFVVRPREGEGAGGVPTEFEGAYGLKLSMVQPGDTGAPYPLLNATLNVRGSQDSMLRYRKGVSFVFSPKYVGCPSTKYASTRSMEAADAHLSLASAAAISAAAAGPNMGSFTSGWLAPLFALLNLRLGYWLPHPELVARGRHFLKNPRLRHVLREALGLVDDKGSFVNVSDGGHFENLGAYELIRRRCRLIVVVDGEQDPRGELRALTTLMRLARIDFGVRISADLAPLRRREDGTVEQPWLWATLHYGTQADGTEEVGHLLYLKAAMMADVPQYVRAYQQESPAFPHESTADQFFDEVQFECYRALGEAIGERATQCLAERLEAGRADAALGSPLSGDRVAVPATTAE